MLITVFWNQNVMISIQIESFPSYHNKFWWQLIFLKFYTLKLAVLNGTKFCLFSLSLQNFLTKLGIKNHMSQRKFFSMKYFKHIHFRCMRKYNWKFFSFFVIVLRILISFWKLYIFYLHFSTLRLYYLKIIC